VNNYEGIFIIKSNLKEPELEGVYKAIADSLAKNKATLEKEEKWGKRDLTYRIKKFKDGVYYKVNFQSPPEAISKLREGYSLNADILRVVITKR